MSGEIRRCIIFVKYVQGFSSINRFKDTKNDKRKFHNSLVSTYLSYCDYYRPR